MNDSYSEDKLQKAKLLLETIEDTIDKFIDDELGGLSTLDTICLIYNALTHLVAKFVINNLVDNYSLDKLKSDIENIIFVNKKNSKNIN